MKLFISGNRSITHLSEEVLRLFQALYITRHGPSNPTSILVGDASGVDWHIQQNVDNCVVYFSGQQPRHYLSPHETKHIQAAGSGRTWHTYKDRAMGEDCDVHIGFVNTSRSGWQHSGTASNHRFVSDLGKPSALICTTLCKEVFL